VRCPDAPPSTLLQATQKFREAYLVVVNHWRGENSEIATHYKAQLAKLDSLIALDWSAVRKGVRWGGG
jgi:hypothetical protein